MNYIILDLEWDSAYCKKKGGFVNQIIQIGAVKLDEHFNQIDRFERVIKSVLGKRLSKRFTELTGITGDEMNLGIPFETAVTEYNNWVGQDIVTLTWSNSDLYAIIENIDLFLENRVSMSIQKYVDLQSYVQNELRLKGFELTNQISLSNAAQLLGISTDNYDMHTALDDSLVTAAILKKTYNSQRFSKYITDATTVDFYKRLTFRSYYISKLDDKDIDKKQLVFTCEKCGKRARRLKKWKFKNRWFCNEFVCDNCKYKFIGRVSFKKTYSGVKVAKRIIYPVESTVKNEITV